MKDNRITLQYSVDENQLKFEVHRLVCNALDRLTSITCDRPPVNAVLAMDTVDEIVGLRTELAKIDQLFGDVTAIIENYIDYRHQQRMQNAMAVEPEISGMPDLDGLAERIQNFKDNVKNHENAD